MAKTNLIFVNQEKYKRAVAIVDVLSRQAKNTEEAELKEKFTRILSEAKVDSEGDEAVKFVYETLGGLIRTTDEQEEVEETKKRAGKKGKKDEGEGDDE